MSWTLLFYFSSTKHQVSEERGITRCLTLLYHACCTGSSSVVPRIHRHAACKAVPLCSGDHSFCYMTLVLHFSHTHHYDFFFNLPDYYKPLFGCCNPRSQSNSRLNYAGNPLREERQCQAAGSQPLTQQLCGIVYFKLYMHVYI